ncbi:MAG: hypothetical protein M3430_18435 [Acidobacteriota bacterium]|nr:hypothetical protein [Acidobacteriota bacterium]
MNVWHSKNWSAMIVGTTMLVVAGGSIIAGFGRHIGAIDPHVRIVADGAFESREERAGVKPLTPSAMDGEVTRTTERLRELSAVTAGIALYSAGERLRCRTPGTVEGLLAGVAGEGLMPPGVTPGTQPGLLAVTHTTTDGGSVAHGYLFVRYRPRPFGIEVVSVGKETRDGPALMMRLPDDAGGDEGASYFAATRLEDVRIPAAFANESQVIAAGWKRERLRAVKVSREEREALHEWAIKHSQ